MILKDIDDCVTVVFLIDILLLSCLGMLDTENTRRPIDMLLLTPGVAPVPVTPQQNTGRGVEENLSLIKQVRATFTL